MAIGTKKSQLISQALRGFITNPGDVEREQEVRAGKQCHEGVIGIGRFNTDHVETGTTDVTDIERRSQHTMTNHAQCRTGEVLDGIVEEAELISL
jgi:hypothetical protein